MGKKFNKDWKKGYCDALKDVWERVDLLKEWIEDLREAAVRLEVDEEENDG